MADLVSSSERAIFSQALVDLFDTNKRNIVVFKSPLQTFTSENRDYLPGYGDAAQEPNITYTPVTGVFEANVFYGPKLENEVLPQTKTTISKNVIKIKVGREARDFIKNGKTESLLVDDNRYNVISDDGQQHFMGAVFYYFVLEGTS